MQDMEKRLAEYRAKKSLNKPQTSSAAKDPLQNVRNVQLQE